MNLCLKGPSLRILFLVNVMVIGGAEVFLLRKIKNLRSKGHLAVLAYAELLDGGISRLINDYLDNKHVHQITYDADSIESLINTYRINIVHTVQAHPKYLQKAKEIDPNIICISTQTASVWDADRKFNHSTYTDAIVTKADSFLPIIQQNIPQLPDRLMVIENGIDLNHFKPIRSSPRERDELLKSLDLPIDKAIILQVARLHPIKNIEGAVEICSQLRKLRSDFILLIAGGHRGEHYRDYYEQLRGKAEEKKIAAHLYFLGEQNDIRQLLSIADCVISTTKAYEGTPNALLEAMAMEKPVVAFRCTGITDVITHENTGFIVEDTDPVQAAEYLSRILDDRKLKRRLGVNGRKTIKKRFNLKRAVAEYEKLYSRLLNIKYRSKS